MTSWTSRQLAELGAVGEIEIAPRHADGRLGRARPIWIVHIGDGLYVRSYLGPDGNWFRTVSRSGRATIHAAGDRYDVELAAAPEIERDAVDDAYRAKYGRSSYVTAMVSDAAAATTARVIPTSERDGR